MDENSTVSIIMPTYNVEPFVKASVQSVLDQTYQDWELLISDDGSTDGTLTVARTMQAADKRIRILPSTGNNGPARARNLAIEASRGRYIAFLDSDDLWKSEKLARQIDFMRRNDIAFSFSSYDRIDETGTFLNTHLVSKPVSYRDLLKTCSIGCLTAIYDTQKLGKVYMPDVRKRQDFALWLRILKMTDYASPVSESLAQYRVRTSSVSSNKLNASKYTWSVLRDVEKLNFATASYYFLHYAWNGIANTYIRPRIAKLMRPE
jgi:teichuronic acid biosynthesis glycosyltransferase TuaG